MVWQLARFEGRRLLRHPAVIFGTVLSLVGAVYLFWGWAPVMDRVSASFTLLLSFLAAGTLLASVDTARRTINREELEEADALPSEASRRIGGALLAVGAPVVLAVTWELVILLIMSTQSPVGPPLVSELVMGPAVVALAGGVGVAVGSLFRSGLAGPLTLIVVAALDAGLASNFINELIYSTGREDVTLSAPGITNWWAPLPGYEFGLPYALQMRPALLHLVYLVALIGAVATFAVATARGGTRRLAWFGGTAALAVAAALIGAAQPDPPTPLDQTEAIVRLLGTDAYECRTRGAVTYCSYADFEPWVGDWQEVVQPVLDRVPMAVTDRVVEIRQFETLHLTPGLTAYGLSDLPEHDGIRTHTWWRRSMTLSGPPGYDPYGLALAAATWVVGLPVDYEWVELSTEEGTFIPIDDAPAEDAAVVSRTACVSADQARALVAQWLAGQATEGTSEYLKQQVDDPGVIPLFGDELPDWGEGFFDYPRPYFGLPVLLDRQLPSGGVPSVRFYLRELYYARQLLDRPDDEVAALIARHWEKLTDPATTTNEAIAILGIDPVPTPVDLPGGGVDRTYYRGPGCG